VRPAIAGAHGQPRGGAPGHFAKLEYYTHCVKDVAILHPFQPQQKLASAKGWNKKKQLFVLNAEMSA
jgi:hypothetical protein